MVAKRCYVASCAAFTTHDIPVFYQLVSSICIQVGGMRIRRPTFFAKGVTCMAQISLTQPYVNSAKCPVAQSKQEVTDVGCKGLVLEVRKSGGKTYYLRYTNHRGKQRQYRIGNACVLMLSQARSKCRTTLNQIANGEDPCDVKAETRRVPTFGQFIEDQYLPYVKSYKRSWDTDVSLLKNHLLPRFSGKYMDEITRQDIVKMHSDRKSAGAAAGSANRLLIMMRYIFNLAVRWEVPGIKANPTKGVPLMEENNKKERYLSVEEAQSLYDAVCKSQNTMLKFIIPMLILTGARKREVLDAKWQDFDFSRRIWRIPMSKSGKARHVPLSDGALNVLSAIPRDVHCEWTFSNPETGKPYVSLFCSWNTARKSVGLADVRVHDLRHSHASFLVNAGRTLYEVQHILGHTQVKTTQRYAHLSQDTLLAAANAANKAVGHLFRPMASTVSPATQVQLVQ
jgi:integrase